MATRGGPPAINRRTFRGRAGPTDRQLPKHQARRRKQGPREESKNKYAADDEALRAQREEDNFVAVLEETQEDARSDALVDDSMELIEEEGKAEAVHPADAEIQHLIRRLRNVRESIQLSADANASPSNWQQNVINAVINCIGEWRAIVNHYEDLDATTCKAPALALYELIQMSMQTGPLAGAKPGYFKRCGSEVAMQALAFLNSIEEPASLYFSEKQQQAIAKWRSNASKAVGNDRPPSKSALKKQRKEKK